MRLPASEKLEIIGLVEQSHRPARRTLQMLGIKPSTFYRWYDRFRSGGLEALEDKPSKPDRVWNRIPDDIRQRVVMMAFEQPELSPRELATRFTDTNSYYVSESSGYRLLKAHDLIRSPAFIIIKAADEFRDKTTAPSRSFLRFCICCGGLLQNAAAALFLQTVAVAADGDDVTVVKEPIEDCGCHHRIAEHGSPLADVSVAGKQDGAFLVATAHQLKEQMRRIRRERQIAKLIDDQEPRLGKLREPLLELSFAISLGELGHDRRGGDELNGIPGQDRFAPERHDEMGLADRK